MLSRLRVSKSLFFALVAVLAAIGTAVAFAAPLRIAGFRSRELPAGGQVDSQGGGDWRVYYAMDEAHRTPHEGDYAARVTQEGPGSNLLLREFRAKQDQRLRLASGVSELRA